MHSCIQPSGQTHWPCWGPGRPMVKSTGMAGDTEDLELCSTTAWPITQESGSGRGARQHWWPWSLVALESELPDGGVLTHSNDGVVVQPGHSVGVAQRKGWKGQRQTSSEGLPGQESNWVIQTKHENFCSFIYSFFFFFLEAYFFIFDCQDIQ